MGAKPLGAFRRALVFPARGKNATMTAHYSFSQTDALESDLELLEVLRWGRKEFADQLCRESRGLKPGILDVLRSEPAYQIAEFLYLLQARGIATEEDVANLAEIHNKYIVDLTKDAEKMRRLGLKRERLLDAIFTADTLPRLLQNWRERPGTIDQSNFARLLVTVMSSETCRKLAVAFAEAGFLTRERSAFGTILVSSTGIVEQIFGSCLREMRTRMQGGRRRT
jgi:hypothetical protein